MDLLTRLKEIIAHYDLTSSTFADTIEVPRSSISHLLSGRNKPSLDFVMKMVDKFPEVDLYWLLYNEGSFPKKEKEIAIEKSTVHIKDEKEAPSLFSKKAVSEEEPVINSNTQFSASTKKLRKVVLLYTDGSFEEFNQ
ncbi:helix-turn-helix transcriptional regulator [Tenacibaculum sp. AHE15PA]|uniref:helix-turn-helix transcriptional regulator n=1 Tax=unclassified Tenacibaculum TaxID=2635139 RepID=UPI001C4E4346|nr:MULTISPECIES: helix-turn-helix transcriptional regulator [unclassified Tenacibaculum]QXP73852.1 helix-turn-helix transcriptional regulator [Tenacibaculum sp. AHE14PA]QXP75781.1 helix-turn-helix transcriptional regulator [Tenacibaculum sp. AHE15PA]